MSNYGIRDDSLGNNGFQYNDIYKDIDILALAPGNIIKKQNEPWTKSESK